MLNSNIRRFFLLIVISDFIKRKKSSRKNLYFLFFGGFLFSIKENNMSSGTRQGRSQTQTTPTTGTQNRPQATNTSSARRQEELRKEDDKAIALLIERGNNGYQLVMDHGMDMTTQAPYNTMFKSMFLSSIYGTQFTQDIKYCYDQVIMDYLSNIPINNWREYDTCNLMKIIFFQYGYIGLIIITHYLLMDPNRKKYDFQRLFEETKRRYPADAVDNKLEFGDDDIGTGNIVTGNISDDFFQVPFLRSYIESTSYVSVSIDLFLKRIDDIFGPGIQGAAERRFEYYEDFRKTLPESLNDPEEVDFTGFIDRYYKSTDELDQVYTDLVIKYFENIVEQVSINDPKQETRKYQLIFENILLEQGIVGLIYALIRLTKNPGLINTFNATQPSLGIYDLLDNDAYRIRKKSLNTSTLFEYGSSSNVLKDEILEEGALLYGDKYRVFLEKKIDNQELPVNAETLRILRENRERIVNTYIELQKVIMDENNDGVVGYIRESALKNIGTLAQYGNLNIQGIDKEQDCVVMDLLFQMLKN